MAQVHGSGFPTPVNFKHDQSSGVQSQEKNKIEGQEQTITYNTDATGQKTFNPDSTIHSEVQTKAHIQPSGDGLKEITEKSSSFLSKPTSGIKQAMRDIKTGVTAFVSTTASALKGIKDVPVYSDNTKNTGIKVGSAVGGAIRYISKRLQEAKHEIKFSAGFGDNAEFKASVAKRLDNAKKNVSSLKAELKSVKAELKLADKKLAEAEQKYATISATKKGNIDEAGKEVEKLTAKVAEVKKNVLEKQGELKKAEDDVIERQKFMDKQPLSIQEKVSNAVGKQFESIKSHTKKLDSPNTLKPGLPRLILQSIWSGSTALKMPGLNDVIKRKQTENNFPISASTFKGGKERISRYSEYSVYPTYPTNAVELTERHIQKLNEAKQDPSKTKASNELSESSKNGTPAFMDLSPEARTLMHEINFELVKEHLADIQHLAEKNNSPALPCDMNYFENEVYDTLARGLAFIDKSMLEGAKIQVPVLIGDTFKMEEYEVQRFNLSGSSGDTTPSDEIHQNGHPIFFLKPTSKEAPPMIIARGTLLADDGKDGAKESIEADGRKDLSLKWVANNPSLDAKVEEMAKHGNGKFKVCGHSLGGNIATILTVKYFSMIDQTITISAAHVNNSIKEKWESIPESARPKLQHILVEGDLVPGGGVIIGEAVLAEQQKIVGDKKKPDYSSNPVERHLKPFNNNSVRYAKIDVDKENKKSTRLIASLNIRGIGRLVQNKSIKELILGTGARKEAYNKLDESIEKSIEKQMEN